MNLLRTTLLAATLSTTTLGAARANPPIRDTVIVDSELTLAQAIAGTRAPQEITRALRIVAVQYYGFDGRLHEGQIIVHRDLAQDVVEIFERIRQLRFPVESVLPIRFDLPDDGTTMDALNNSCGFHYRVISTFKTTKLSYHAYGRAVDINPFQNPAILRDGTVIPAGASFDPAVRGTIDARSPIVSLFRERGWEWGGAWRSLKDYMHFEKH